jgi:hypothetical protein
LRFAGLFLKFLFCFLRGKQRKEMLARVYILSLAFDCSKVKCKNSISEQEKTFYNIGFTAVFWL